MYPILYCCRVKTFIFSLNRKESDNEFFFVFFFVCESLFVFFERMPIMSDKIKKIGPNTMLAQIVILANLNLVFLPAFANYFLLNIY